VSYTSLFDLFTIGIGPSSSHTVGPMVAARRFADRVADLDVDRVEVRLFGSLGLTGKGHATDLAVTLGLMGHDPELVPMEVVESTSAGLSQIRTVLLAGRRRVSFWPGHDVVFRREARPEHANVIELEAFSGAAVVDAARYASVGGGFVVDLGVGNDGPPASDFPHPYDSAAALVAMAGDRSIAAIAWENETSLRPPETIRERVGTIGAAMFDSIDRGLATDGPLPGGLGVTRRARRLALDLVEGGRALPPTEATDWAGVWAIAVNEENAAGHRVVTAPTNGAAGIVPAVLRFALERCKPQVPGPQTEFLLTATAIGSLIKENAGISGAELGCQGEVGAACAMAASGLAAVLGGSPAQVENAAEIALEHNLGLTCDPVGGLVQVPCIERNAVGAAKAITAASLALRGDGVHLVSLDVAIETLRQTGRDMDGRYKETGLGGLAVNLPEC
jgi:L-serine dehydratase